MAKSKSTAARKAAAARNPRTNPICHSPTHGLMVNMRAQFPETADDKVICAKNIIQAVVAAHDAESLEGENYDLHWPLSLAVKLLEQAASQIEKLEARS